MEGTYLSKVADEKFELDERIKKLSDFIESEKFVELDSIQQNNLKVQKWAMYTYSMILLTRIDYDTGKLGNKE